MTRSAKNTTGVYSTNRILGTWKLHLDIHNRKSSSQPLVQKSTAVFSALRSRQGGRSCGSCGTRSGCRPPKGTSGGGNKCEENVSKSPSIVNSCRRDHRQRQGLDKCEATNTLVLLVAIREGIDVAVVEEGVVAISPGELLYKGAGFYDKRCVGRDCIRRRRPYISSGQTSFLVKWITLWIICRFLLQTQQNRKYCQTKHISIS